MDEPNKPDQTGTARECKDCEGTGEVYNTAIYPTEPTMPCADCNGGGFAKTGTAREWVDKQLVQLYYSYGEECDALPDDDAHELADRCDRAEAERDQLRAREKAIIHFCETEMSWMYFRAEYELSANPTTTEQNASKMRDYLKQHGGLPASTKELPHV